MSKKRIVFFVLGICMLFFVSAKAQETAFLTNLMLEDTAQLLDFAFDKNIHTYNLTVYEEVYGIRFTPTIEGARLIMVTIKGDGIKKNRWRSLWENPLSFIWRRQKKRMG